MWGCTWKHNGIKPHWTVTEGGRDAWTSYRELIIFLTVTAENPEEEERSCRPQTREEQSQAWGGWQRGKRAESSWSVTTHTQHKCINRERRQATVKAGRISEPYSPYLWPECKQTRFYCQFLLLLNINVNKFWKKKFEQSAAVCACTEHQGLLETDHHRRSKLRSSDQINVIPLKCHRF